MSNESLSKNKNITLLKFYPWIVISLCASLLFYKYVLNVSPSIMAHELMRQFNVNGASLGNLAATFFYTYTIVQIFAGVLVDRFGVRYLSGFSILISALGAYLFSVAESLTLATIARGMMGIGIAFATVTYLKMTAVWFRANQVAFIGGLLATAVMLGAVFGQAPLSALMEQTSWRFVLIFCSILGMTLTMLFIIFMRDAPKFSIAHTLQNDSPTLKQGFSLHEVRIAIKSKQNWLLTLYSGLAFSPLSVLGGLWGNPFLQEAYHLTRTEAASIISLIFVGFGVGGPIFGLISDRLGKRLAVMKCGMLLSLIFIMIVLYVPRLPVSLMAICLFSFGCAVGSFMLGFTVGTETNKLSLAATIIALINTGDSVFESFTEPFLGKLLDLGWNGQWIDGVHYFSVDNYRLAFTPLPIYFILALILLYFIKEPVKKDI